MRRVVRAARLDAGLYEEVEADHHAVWQALAVVVLAAGAASAGRQVLDPIERWWSSVVMGVGGWCVWSWLTYLIGTRLLPEPQTTAGVGELFRTVGFATAPGVLRVLGVVPGLAGVVFAATALWMVAAMVVAVRQALDYESTGRAIVVCGLGWLAQVVLMRVVLFLLGDPAPPA